MPADPRKIKLGVICVVGGVEEATVSLIKVLGSGMRGCELRESRLVPRVGEDHTPLAHEARHVCLYPGSAVLKEEVVGLQDEHRVLPFQNAASYGGTFVRRVGGGNACRWGAFQSHRYSPTCS